MKIPKLIILVGVSVIFSSLGSLAVLAAVTKTPAKKVATKTVTKPIIKTVVKPIANKKIAGVPRLVNTFLDKADIDKLNSYGFKVYTGKKPPVLNGKFYFDLPTVIYDPGIYPGTYEIGDVFEPYIYEFTKQKKDGSLRVSYNSEEADDKAQNLKAYVSGQNGCFTVFVNQTGKQKQCNYKSPQLISGCLTKEGVKNFTVSYLTKSQTGDCSERAPTGYLRIANEEDGLAANTPAPEEQEEILENIEPTSTSTTELNMQ